jgi:hypothetical protein
MSEVKSGTACLLESSPRIPLRCMQGTNYTALHLPGSPSAHSKLARSHFPKSAAAA